MDWKKLGKVVATAGGTLLGSAIGMPAAGPALGAIVGSAFGVDPENPDAIAQAVAADPEAHIKLRQIELDHETEIRSMMLQAETNRLAQINQTMRAEAQADDAYVRRWRPTWGYVTAATWAVQACAIAVVIVKDPDKAPAVIAAFASLSAMWGIALAVLGVSVVKRSDDKAVRAGKPDAGFGILSAIARRIAGKPAESIDWKGPRAETP